MSEQVNDIRIQIEELQKELLKAESPEELEQIEFKIKKLKMQQELEQMTEADIPEDDADKSQDEDESNIAYVSDFVHANGSETIKCIKQIREYTGLGLKEAKALVDAYNSRGEDVPLTPIDTTKTNLFIESKQYGVNAPATNPSFAEKAKGVGQKLNDVINSDTMNALAEMGNGFGIFDIERTIIVGQDSKRSATSSAARGLVGAAVLGPVGALAGGVSGKNKNKTTFQVIYKNGRQKTVTVKNNSAEFKKLCKYLDK